MPAHPEKTPRTIWRRVRPKLEHAARTRATAAAHVVKLAATLRAQATENATANRACAAATASPAVSVAHHAVCGPSCSHASVQKARHDGGHAHSCSHTSSGLTTSRPHVAHISFPSGRRASAQSRAAMQHATASAAASTHASALTRPAAVMAARATTAACDAAEATRSQANARAAANHAATRAAFIGGGTTHATKNAASRASVCEVAMSG